MRKTNKADLETIEWLALIRWPHGIKCPSCQSGDISDLVKTRGIWQCRSCRVQFGIFNGTRFEGTRLSPFKLKKFVEHYFNESVKNGYEIYIASRTLADLHKESELASKEEAESELKIMEELLNEGLSHSEIAYIIYGHGEVLFKWKGPIGVQKFAKAFKSFSTAQRLHLKLRAAPFSKDMKIGTFVKGLLKSVN